MRILVMCSVFQVYSLAGHCTYYAYVVGFEFGVLKKHLCNNNIPGSTTIGFWNIEVRSEKRREDTINLLEFVYDKYIGFSCIIVKLLPVL